MPTKTFATSQEERIKAVRDRILDAIDEPLEPTEFCEKWVKHPLHRRDYLKACNTAIADALGLFSAGDVSLWGKTWSKRPSYVPWLLRLADIVKEAKSLGVCANRSESYRRTVGNEVCICLPFGIPQPQFHFWQRVKINDETQDHGCIVGMDYVTEARLSKGDRGWWYSIELDPSIPDRQIEPIRSAPQSIIKAL